MKKRYPLGKYGLSIVLVALFLGCWTAQTYYGWKKFESEKRQQNEVATFSGENGYVNDWMQATMENWQSEFLQLFSFVGLTAVLIHKGSHESRDTDDEFEERLKRIEEKLDRLAVQKTLEKPL